MLSALFFSTLFVLRFMLAMELNPDVAPGSNFNLTHYCLTLPDVNASSVWPNQLNNGYHSQYFYTDKDDGSMTFYAPSTGGSTPNSEYTRSELHHMCDPNNIFMNWSVQKGHYYQNVTLRIGENTTNNTIISQIHAMGAPPLAKIRWIANESVIRAEYKLTENDEPENEVIMATVHKGELFNVMLEVINGRLSFWYNGIQHVTANISHYWGKYGNFFKIGDYFITNSTTGASHIAVYKLDVMINGDCTYYNGTPTC